MIDPRHAFDLRLDLRDVHVPPGLPALRSGPPSIGSRNAANCSRIALRALSARVRSLATTLATTSTSKKPGR